MIDGLPNEVSRNDVSDSCLHSLFNVCYSKGIVPSEWEKCIINPIPKSNTQDKKHPMSYRGIALVNTMYKLYCRVLNQRLSTCAESNSKLEDEQNGFQKKTKKHN